MTITLKAFLCPRYPLFDSSGSGNAIKLVDECDNQVETEEGSCSNCGNNSNKIDFPFMFFPLKKKTKQYIKACLTSEIYNLEDTEITCIRGIREDSFGEQTLPAVRDKWLTFTFNKWPDGLCVPCAWKGTYVNRRNINTSQFYYIRPVIPLSGPIPISGDKEDSTSIDLDNEEVIWATNDPECVPGDYISIVWKFKSYKTLVNELMNGFTFMTPAFLGGEILSVNQQGDHLFRTLTVRIHGIGDRVVLPTDFADYQVGSWVYLLRTNSSSGRQKDREEEFVVSDEDVVSETVTDIMDELLYYTNQARLSNGVSSLTIDPTLMAAANRHVIDMSSNTMLEHTGTDGSTVFDRVSDAGFFKGWYGDDGDSYSIAENIGVGAETGEAMVEAWLNSVEGHRENLLNPVFNSVGFGVMYSEEDDNYYFEQVFGYRSDISPEIPDGDSSLFLRPTPVTFNKEQNIGLVDTYDWESLDYNFIGMSDFSKAFELCIHNGKILGVNPNTNKANVLIGETVYEGVSIHYHCPLSSSVDTGHKAFGLKDEVLLIDEGGDKSDISTDDLKIIGFTNQPRPCVDGPIICFGLYDFDALGNSPAADETKYGFYDVKNSTIYNVLSPVDGSILSQPFTEDDLTALGTTYEEVLSYNMLDYFRARELNTYDTDQTYGTGSFVCGVNPYYFDYRQLTYTCCYQNDPSPPFFTSIDYAKVFWDYKSQSNNVINPSLGSVFCASNTDLLDLSLVRLSFQWYSNLRSTFTYTIHGFDGSVENRYFEVSGILLPSYLIPPYGVYDTAKIYVSSKNRNIYYLESLKFGYTDISQGFVRFFDFIHVSPEISIENGDEEVFDVKISPTTFSSYNLESVYNTLFGTTRLLRESEADSNYNPSFSSEWTANSGLTVRDIFG